MHLLPCPSCQASIPVSPSQAGDQTHCPECQEQIQIPSLGEIRRLPKAQSDLSESTSRANHEVTVSTGRRAAFVVFALLATACLLVAAFCAIRWSLIDVPMTTDEHVAYLRDQYSKVSAAELIREYEQMEKYGLDLANPYGYKKLAITKSQWGQNASIAGGIGAAAMLAAFLMAGSGRQKRPSPEDT